MTKLIVISAFILFACVLRAQSSLKLEEIMKGNAFIGMQPENPRWSCDGKSIFFDWNPQQEPGNSLYIYTLKEAKVRLASIKEYELSLVRDPEQFGRECQFYLRNGALCSYESATEKHKVLLHSSKKVSNLQVLNQGKTVCFEWDGNLWLLKNNSEFIQITNFKQGNGKTKEDEPNSYLNDQQLELFVHLREQERQRNWRKKQQENKQLTFPEVYHYGNFSLENLQLSPDENFVFFRLSKYAEGLETTYEKHITDNGYSQQEKARDKVSIHALSSHKMGIYNRTKDSVYFVDFSNLSNLDQLPAYLSLYSPGKPYPDAKRKLVMHQAVCSQNGKHILLEVRSLDNKDRWIVKLDPYSGKVDELEHQHDPAWIGGPGISEWNFEPGTLGFLADQENFYFQSEESGYSHLYTMHVVTKKKRQLTAGNWEVRGLSLSRQKNWFYLSANKTHPGNIDFYRLSVDGKTWENLLTADGAHDTQLSPDEKYLLVRYSYKNKPWELYLATNKTNSILQPITHSTSAAFEAYKWREPEVISFVARDQTEVHARLYAPEKSKKNGAAVIFVHGAGYLQNAHNHWSNYLREYMFHNLLADEGFTVLDIDYRASDGYGRDFRTGIYRHMGGFDLSDQLDGRKLLIDQYGIDSNRIGIYGGSYGGFITLMGLLTAPDAFACGAALRSVTDWAHYNLDYTCNILNFPETDPEAYRKSSPIYFAENLNKPLLMLHGMVDDNVQFQDIVRLSQRFIELGKKNWELAVFPVEAHGFKESSSWADEYRRIYELFHTYLLK